MLRAVAPTSFRPRARVSALKTPATARIAMNAEAQITSTAASANGSHRGAVSAGEAD